MILPDSKEWLSQVRSAVDALKVVLSSNGRLPINWRTAEASVAESIFKEARNQVEPE